MSRYAVDKVLWEISRNDRAARAYLDEPEAFLAGRALGADERGWLIDRDFPAMFAAGAHPFLLYTFRIVVSGGWSWPMMVEHAKALEHISPPLDITT